MSRSSPGAPAYLLTAIYAVERVLAASEEPLTAREVAERLRAEGFRWPLPAGYFHSRGRTVVRDELEAEPTMERVRRICEMTHNRTHIESAGGRPKRYRIYGWSRDRVLTRARSTP